MNALIPLLFGLALIGFPLFLLIAALALVGFISSDLNPVLYFAELLRLANNPALLAIPLFTLAGYILAESNAPERLVRLARAVTGNTRGGLAVIAVAILAIFTAFTGASGVTIVAMGGLLLPMLLKGKYSERFSLGLITASGSIGLLFPPSLPLIIYGFVSETSIDRLFIAGIIPGILMVSGLSIYSVKAARIKIAKEPEVKSEPLIPALKSAIWELPLPVIIIGGIYSGLFTATEAAIVTVTYLIVVECFILKDIHPIRRLPGVIRESSVLIGGILLILGSALALTNFLIFADVPTLILDWMKGFVSSRFAFLLLLNIFLLIVGCLMDVFSALVVVVPLILPLALEYGIDPVHLGIIFLANLEIGYCTPPVGLNLFISSFRFNKPILDIYKAALPFLLVQLIALALITYIPALTLYPLELFGK